MKRLAILAFAVLMLTLVIATAADAGIFHHTVFGTNGNDDLIAPFGYIGQDDTVYGLGGRDDIFGAEGDDDLYGGNGQDRILGDYDDDYIVGGKGWDYLSGNANADTIKAADGRADDVFCGSGSNDKATVDKADTVGGCETVNVVR